MKRIKCIILSIVLLISAITPVYADNQNIEDYSLNNNIKNKQALEIYRKKVKSKLKSFSSKSVSNYFMGTNVSTDSTEKSLIDNFKEFNVQKSIYKSETDSVFTNVIYSPENNSYGIIEIDSNEDHIFIELNEEPYKIYLDGEDVVLKDSKGKITPLYYTVDDTIKSQKNTSGTLGIIIDNPDPNDGYSAYRGPYYKTNKIIFTVLRVITIAGGARAMYLTNPTLGVITYLAEKAIDAGDKYTATLYIKYFQANKLTDPTYVKQKEDYYKDSNHKDYIKTIYRYFYSERPY